MPEVYEVDLFATDPYDVSALIISTWACPEDKEKALRERLYLSLCSLFIRDSARRGAEWAQRPQLIIPNQACRAEDDIRSDVKTLERRFKDRMTAGRMVVAFLQEVEMGTVPPLPPRVDRISINEMAGYALEGRGIVDRTNMKSRVFRPSRRVLHLCAAWVTLAQEHFAEHGEPLEPVEAMRKPEFLALFLHRAQLMEPLIERSRLNLTAADLIRFRLLPKGGSKKS